MRGVGVRMSGAHAWLALRNGSLLGTGAFGPSGVPRAIVTRLNTEMVKAVRAPDVVTLLETNGSEVLGTAPEDLKAFVDSDIELWTRVVHARNIHAD